MAVSGDPRVASEGCSVLLDINDGDRHVFARLSPKATLKIGKNKFSLHPLIGCPFGTLFRVETGPDGSLILARCSPNASEDSGNRREKTEGKDNRLLIDNNTAQCLSAEDIDAMRKEGATGDEIIKALIANSSTFGEKTTFSQEKYKLKKQKKYMPKVLLRRPFTRSICEAYLKKHPARIGFLRVDTLSLLLSMGNVGAYSDVLVVDMVGGLVTAAAAERIGGTGFVCNTYFATKSSLGIVGLFNFSNEICSRIVQAPFSDLCSAQKNNNESSLHQNTLPLEKESINGIDSLLTECILPNASEITPTSQEAVQTENVALDDICDNSADYKSVAGGQASAELIRIWKGTGFTSLIVAAPELEVMSIVQKLLPLLSYSAPFAIYHQYLQPLATCMQRLQVSKLAIKLQISEPWLREYQVLPSRTHPHMQMNGFGGYILSGIRICDSENFS